MKVFVAIDSLKPLVENWKFPLRTSYLVVAFFISCFIFQAGHQSSPLLSYSAFTLSLFFVLLALMFGKRMDLFIFLYLIVATRIPIPFLGREYSLVLPFVFLLVSVVRFLPRVLRPKRSYARSVSILLVVVFFIFCLFQIFYKILIPGVNAEAGSNSGLLNRFNLLNSFLTFFASLLLFDWSRFTRWATVFLYFNVTVLLISMLIIVFRVPPIPFFNTFTWSLLDEGGGSYKMIIAGFSSLAIIIYIFTMRAPWTSANLIMILLCFMGLIFSGSRISFLTGALILLIIYFQRRRVFGKAIIVLLACCFIGFKVLTSSLILLIPERYQRLAIILPSEFYQGELSELASSAAASSSSFRYEIWKMAMPEIADKPLLGNGFGIPSANYSFSGTAMEDFQKIPTEIIYHDFLTAGSLHNTFFSVAYVLGLPALILFIFVLGRLIWRHYYASLSISSRTNDFRFVSVLLTSYFIFAIASDIIFNLEFFLVLAVATKGMSSKDQGGLLNSNTK